MSAQSENNGAYVQKMLDEVFRSDATGSGGTEAADDIFSFCNNPSQYIWTYAGFREILIPYRDGSASEAMSSDATQKETPHAPVPRWRPKSMWIVDGVLCRGESNRLQRRRFYIDPESWAILLGEGYDASGKILAFFKAELNADSTCTIAGKWEWL